MRGSSSHECPAVSSMCLCCTGDTINVAWRWRTGGKAPSRFSKVELMRYWPYRWDESIGAARKCSICCTVVQEI